jgi:hypothetical protein
VLRHLPRRSRSRSPRAIWRYRERVADDAETIVDAHKIGGRGRPHSMRRPASRARPHRARRGDAAAAAELLRRARDEWQNVGAPYETAQARLALGTAFRRAVTSPATGEFEAALATFERPARARRGSAATCSAAWRRR